MSRLHLRQTRPDREHRLVHVTPESAGWEYVGFDLYKLAPGEVLKEYHSQAGEKTVLVAEKDAATSVKVKLSWGRDDAAYQVKKDGAEVKVLSKAK